MQSLSDFSFFFGGGASRCVLQFLQRQHVFRGMCGPVLTRGATFKFIIEDPPSREVCALQLACERFLAGVYMT